MICLQPQDLFEHEPALPLAALGGSENAVFIPFFPCMMLALETQKVVELRLVRLAWGGRECRAEMLSMLIEKIQAGMEAATILRTGVSRQIEGYELCRRQTTICPPMRSRGRLIRNRRPINRSSG